MQSWQVYRGFPANSGSNVGKWPLPVGSGERAEQDWQASDHNVLRQAFQIGNTKNKVDFDTVYPFSFTTDDLQALADSTSKAWVVITNPSTTELISKRDGVGLLTDAALIATTMVITGDDKLDKRWLFDEMQPRAQPVANTLTSPILAIRTPMPVATHEENPTSTDALQLQLYFRGFLNAHSHSTLMAPKMSK
jgi:hypothetical protein